MGKTRVPPKVQGNRRMEDKEPTMRRPKGCPCPGLKGCLIGQPVTQGEESITLICSATWCPFSGIPIHKQCFEKYEDQLLKTLADKGSARGWTEYKARRNLWRPSGQGLMAMHCRCVCEKGNVHPPEEVVLAERLLVETRDGDKRKKTKKRDLPVINMNGGANVRQARMQAQFEREEREREMVEEERTRGSTKYHTLHTPRRTRNNSVTSFSSQSIISTSSNNRTAVSCSLAGEEVPMFIRGRGGRRGGRKREESRARLDSGVSLRTPFISPVKESSPLVIRAVTPPPMTRSYADTIALSQGSSSCDAICQKGGDPLSPPRPLFKADEVILNCDAWYTRTSPEWEIVSLGHYDPSILRSHESPSSLSSLTFNHMYTPVFNPWEGQNFDVGELTICGRRIPSKANKLPPYSS